MTVAAAAPESRTEKGTRVARKAWMAAAAGDFHSHLGGTALPARTAEGSPHEEERRQRYHFRGSQAASRIGPRRQVGSGGAAGQRDRGTRGRETQGRSRTEPRASRMDRRRLLHPVGGREPHWRSDFPGDDERNSRRLFLRRTQGGEGRSRAGIPITSRICPSWTSRASRSSEPRRKASMLRPQWSA